MVYLHFGERPEHTYTPEYTYTLPVVQNRLSKFRPFVTNRECDEQIDRIISSTISTWSFYLAIICNHTSN